MVFNLVQNRKENCHHDHIPFNVKGIGNICCLLVSIKGIICGDLCLTAKYEGEICALLLSMKYEFEVNLEISEYA